MEQLSLAEKWSVLGFSLDFIFTFEAIVVAIWENILQINVVLFSQICFENLQFVDNYLVISIFAILIII